MQCASSAVYIPSSGQWSPLQRAEMTLIRFNAHLDHVEVVFGGFKHETTLSLTSAPNSLFSGLSLSFLLCFSHIIFFFLAFIPL